MEEVTKETIQRASTGDIDAFEDIYRAYSGFVFRIALRITNNNADALDVTQEVFMKIYKGLSDFQFRSSLKTWVYRIAVNMAINIHKKNMRQLSRMADYDVAIETAGYLPSIKEDAERSDAEKLLSSLLDKLPPEHKAVVILREIEGLSYEEISRVLKINLNTVRTRLKRARQALLKHGEKAVQNEL